MNQKWHQVLRNYEVMSLVLLASLALRLRLLWYHILGSLCLHLTFPPTPSS